MTLQIKWDDKIFAPETVLQCGPGGHNGTVIVGTIFRVEEGNTIRVNCKIQNNWKMPQNVAVEDGFSLT